MSYHQIPPKSKRASQEGTGQGGTSTLCVEMPSEKKRLDTKRLSGVVGKA